MQNNKNYQFKVATVQNPRDGSPTVQTHTIESFIQCFSQPVTTSETFDKYHYYKKVQKDCKADSVEAKNDGRIEDATQFKLYESLAKKQLDEIKFGQAIMPFIFKNDVTFFEGKDGKRQRDNKRITHFSLIMLDIESNLSKEAIHTILADYEYVLWTTISSAPNSPRYRVALFPEAPLLSSQAKDLIYRIDWRFPEFNDLSKKTLNIDPASLEEGRLMFTPRWLKDHPQEFEFVHNTGKLVTADCFPLSQEQQEAFVKRIKLSQDYRTTKTQESVKRLKEGPTEHALIIVHDDKNYVNPEAHFETLEGWVRLADVNGKISNVACPFHNDANGSEFLDINSRSGRPQFVCHSCGTFKMLPPSAHPKDEAAELAKLLSSMKKKPAAVEVLQQLREDSKDKSFIKYNTDNNAASKVVEVNERYLSDIRSQIPDKGVVFVGSPKGTGKTESIVKIVLDAKANGKTVVLLTHRISLARNLSSRTGLVNYQDLPPGTSAPHMVICINSVSTRLEEVDANYDIVLIDESEQVLRNLLSETLKRSISDVFTKMVLLIQNAQQVITFDADMSFSLTLKMIDKIRNEDTDKNTDDTYVAIKNTYKIGAGKSVTMVENRHQMIAQIVNDFEAGHNIFVASSTATAARLIGTALQTIAPEKKVLILTSETIETEEAQRFIASATADKSNEIDPLAALIAKKILVMNDDAGEPEIIQVKEPHEVVKYDAVVASPTLQTGFSIEGDHFSKVFGYFKSVQGITYQDYDQAIARVRNEKADVSVWIASSGVDTAPNPLDSYIQASKAKEAKTRMRLHGEVAFTKGELLWAWIEATINREVHIRSNQRKSLFINMKRDQGYEVFQYEHDAAMISYGEDIDSITSELVTPQHPYHVFEARDISEEEYNELSRKHGRKTNDEHLQIERYRIKFYLQQPLTFELVKQAIKERMLNVLSRVKVLVHADEEQRRAYDTHDRERHHVSFTHASHNSMQHELLVRQLASLASVDVDSLLSDSAKGIEREITLEQLDIVVKEFKKRETDFNHHFNLNIGKSAQKKSQKDNDSGVEEVLTPAQIAKAEEAEKARIRKRVWDGTFGKIGLELVRRQAKVKGKVVSKYFIDLEEQKLTHKGFGTLESSSQAAKAPKVKDPNQQSFTTPTGNRAFFTEEKM